MDPLPCPTEQVSCPTGDPELVSSLLTEWFVELGFRIGTARDMSGEPAPARDFASRPARFLCIYPDPGRKWVTIVESGGLADTALAARISLHLPGDTLLTALHESSAAWGWQLFRQGAVFEGQGFPASAFLGLQMADGPAGGNPKRDAHEFAWKRGIVTPYLDYWELMDIAEEQRRSRSIWWSAARG